MFLGLRTAVYHAKDLDLSTEWYSRVLGIEPYFKEPFYVGFNVAGYELGLDPDPSAASGPGGVGAYWGVPDIEAALKHLLEQGGKPNGEIQDVGGGIRVATVLDPSGNVFGVIENPHFKLPDA
jgi:predicted enzyme related to lactoylglutathione lyase